jgi:hypothetical protein
MSICKSILNKLYDIFYYPREIVLTLKTNLTLKEKLERLRNARHWHSLIGRMKRASRDATDYRRVLKRYKQAKMKMNE